MTLKLRVEIGKITGFYNWSPFECKKQFLKKGQITNLIIH